MPRRWPTRLTAWICLALLTVVARPTLAADDVKVVSATALAQKAWKMAREGQLDSVWASIRKLPGDDAQLKDLRTRLETHLKLEAEQQKTRQTAFEKNVEELEGHLASKALDKALTSAIVATPLAKEPQVFLNGPLVKKLAAVTVKKAQALEANQKWLDSLSLYGGLERLFDNEHRYTTQYRRVARRVTALRVYAPQLLFDLYVKQAAEQGEKKPEPWKIEKDHWKKLLRDINPQMLYDSLSLAATRHVEGVTIKKMLLGSFEALEQTLDTKGLETTFPALKNKASAKRFLTYLHSLRKEISKLAGPISPAEASQFIGLLLEENDLTVKLPQRLLVHELGNGAMEQLDDYSIIIWPHQKSLFERTTQGRFYGVGIQITLVNKQLTVVTPLEGTPAHKARIKAGDKIVKINGENTIGFSLAQAVEKITGPEGSEVVLDIESPGVKDVRTVKLTRAKIPIVSIKGWQRKVGGGWDYYIDREQKIGYLRLLTFGPTSTEDLSKAVEKMQQDQGINGLILDLRGNPGGLLRAAIGVSDRFLEKGVIVSRTKADRPAMATRASTFPDFPMVVLINQGSASASEIVAGALKIHRRSLTVGARSFGKGSVQDVVGLGVPKARVPFARRQPQPKAYLKLTTQYYKIPDGTIIHHRPGANTWGIEPDVTVRMTNRQYIALTEARTMLDVLKDDPNEKVAPVRIRDPKDGEAAPKVDTASDLLTKGLDPQLNTGLLLLKARLLSQKLATR
jgi:carboxyl-terminal processing protease